VSRHKPELGDLPEADAQLLAQAYRQVIPLKGHARVRHEPDQTPRRASEQTLQRRAQATADSPARAGLSDGDPLTVKEAQEDYRASGISSEMLRRLRREGSQVRQCLDLHGLTRDQARITLQHFIQTASAHGIHRVRIIHGQGYGSQGGNAVLRYLTRHWLTQMPEVLGFVTPNAAQGGKGAVLVLLRLTQSGHQRQG
jgi:DNA-nicking Smr family endonuclease